MAKKEKQTVTAQAVTTFTTTVNTIENPARVVNLEPARADLAVAIAAQGEADHKWQKAADVLFTECDITAKMLSGKDADAEVRTMVECFVAGLKYSGKFGTTDITSADAFKRSKDATEARKAKKDKRMVTDVQQAALSWCSSLSSESRALLVVYQTTINGLMGHIVKHLKAHDTATEDGSPKRSPDQMIVDALVECIKTVKKQDEEKCQSDVELILDQLRQALAAAKEGLEKKAKMLN